MFDSPKYAFGFEVSASECRDIYDRIAAVGVLAA